jgi:chemotaxis signal transduction protein
MGDRLGRVTADDLRRAFDDAFARRPVPHDDEAVDLLTVRVGPAAFALRVAEVDGVHRCPTVTAVPSKSTSLLGIVALRGELLGLHCIHRLMSGASVNGEARWIVVCRRDAVALALDDWTGHVRVLESAIRADESGRNRMAPSVTRVADDQLSVLSVPAIVHAITAGAPEMTLNKG